MEMPFHEESAMLNVDKIKPDMPVVCGMDANAQFATVDHVEGEEIKLKRDASGKHHYFPTSWVRELVDGKVQVDRAARDVMANWRTGPN
jgi:hypothetical protein